MDRAEAIKELTQWRDQMKSHGVPNYGKKLTALDLAIEALKEKHQLSRETSTNTPTCNQKQVTSKLDCISRQQAIEALMAHFIPQTYTGEQVEQAEKLAQKIMNKVPPVTPKVSEDCISRQAAIKYIDDYAHMLTTGNHFEGMMNAVDLLKRLDLFPPVTPTVKVRQVDTLIIATALQNFAQDSERNISDRERAEELREQVLAYGASMCQPVTPTERTGITTDIALSLYEEIRCEALCTNPMKSDRGCDGGCQYDKELLKRIDEVIEKVLVDSPTERTAEWTNTGVLTVHCSNCKSEFHELEAMNYCPNCGAKMKGGTENDGQRHTGSHR